MTEPKNPLPHKLTLSERTALTVTGVREVTGFDEETVVAHTDHGTLVVQGSGLKLKTLSPEDGQVTVSGQISALLYEDSRSSRSFWQRLWG